LIGLCRERDICFDRKKVADIGTYLGYLPRLRQNVDRSCRVIGMDLDERSLGLAKHLCPTCEFVNFDPFCSPGPYTGYFNIIFCSEVFEHMIAPDQSLTALIPLLAPGGTLILTVPNGRNDQSSAG
jgi:2-polyprenyl-3-methyl-5-hydroxy-6-metoxy-1,4-benzoquinol methylase